MFTILIYKYVLHFEIFREKQEAVHSLLSSERRRLEDLQNDAMLDALVSLNRFFLVLCNNYLNKSNCDKIVYIFV